MNVLLSNLVPVPRFTNRGSCYISVCVVVVAVVAAPFCDCGTCRASREEVSSFSAVSFFFVGDV